MKNIIFITSYPKKNFTHGASTVGVASFAKNTLRAIKQVAGKNISLTVLAEKLSGEDEYSEKGIKVKRIWDRNSLKSFPTLLQEIRNSKDTKTIVIEFELAMFGDIKYLLPFPLFLAALRLMGKKVVIVLHHVATDTENVMPHMNISPFTFKGLALGMGIKAFYRVLALLSNRIIVFEEALKNKLSKFSNSRKIVVIPHGVEKFTNIPAKRVARKSLGLQKDDYIILSFGFLAWYKGTDWIVNAVADIKKENKKSNIKLILAGGANPNRTDKEFYNKYIESLMGIAQVHDITITGFVPEKKIVEYYAASDVVVFPYRTHMSSSGPLSMAFAFKKPFLLSSALKNVLQQDDILKFLKELKISPEKIIFKETSDLAARIKEIKRSKVHRTNLSALSQKIAAKRDWNEIGKSYYKLLWSDNYGTSTENTISNRLKSNKNKFSLRPSMRING